jgi:hypothetical protein
MTRLIAPGGFVHLSRFARDYEPPSCEWCGLPAEWINLSAGSLCSYHLPDPYVHNGEAGLRAEAQLRHEPYPLPPEAATRESAYQTLALAAEGTAARSAT